MKLFSLLNKFIFIYLDGAKTNPKFGNNSGYG